MFENDPLKFNSIPQKLQELRQNWVHSKDYFPPFFLVDKTQEKLEEITLE